jgi:PAS domain-containing protein
LNAAAHIRKQQWADVKTTLQTQVDRNPDLLSIGVRSDLGVLRIDTGHHREMWPKDISDKSMVYPVEVPITQNRRIFGKVELCFRQTHSSTFIRSIDFPVVRLLGFFVVCGIFAYTLFVVRVLRAFNGTQMVPERVRGALDTLAEGLLVLDEEGRIVLANQAFADVLEDDPENLAKSWSVIWTGSEMMTPMTTIRGRGRSSSPSRRPRASCDFS